jgi:hypothetical protein
MTVRRGAGSKRALQMGVFSIAMILAAVVLLPRFHMRRVEREKELASEIRAARDMNRNDPPPDNLMDSPLRRIGPPPEYAADMR